MLRYTIRPTWRSYTRTSWRQWASYGAWARLAWPLMTLHRMWLLEVWSAVAIAIRHLVLGIMVIMNADCDLQFGAMVAWDVFYHDGEEITTRSKGCQQEWR